MESVKGATEELYVRLSAVIGRCEMYTNVKVFKAKLILFSRQISNNSLAHFPTLAMLKYSKSLDKLCGECCC